MSLKPLVSGCILSYALLIPAHAASTDPVVVVNGETLTEQDYDNYVKVRAKQANSNVTVDTQTLIEEMIQRELLRQDALHKKLDKHPEFIQKLKETQDNLLMAMGMHDYLEKHPLDDAALKKEYDKQLAKIEVPKEYKAWHILVESEAEAKAIIAELGKGKAFAELAQEKSTDTGSAKSGGDLGWITKSKVAPEFSAALEKLEKGKYTTTPVKSQYGWHIIQLDDMRDTPLPSFESVKERIRAGLQGKLMQEYVDGLRKTAKVEIIKKVETIKK